jgi:hypothetical protein
MDRLVLDASNILLGLDMLETVSFVPAGGKDIKRNLSANGVPVSTSRQ